MFRNGSFAKRPRVAHMFNHGWWRLAVGGWWRLAVGGWWRLVVFSGGWWLVIGGWWRLAVVGGWRLVAAGGWWRLAAGGGWWLAVGDPLGRSLRAVFNQKKISSSPRTPLMAVCTMSQWGLQRSGGPATVLQPRPPSHGRHCLLSSVCVRLAIECPMGPSWVTVQYELSSGCGVHTVFRVGPHCTWGVFAAAGLAQPHTSRSAFTRALRDVSIGGGGGQGRGGGAEMHWKGGR